MHTERNLVPAETALAAYLPTEYKHEPSETQITDLIVDLLHLADTLEVDGERIAERALMHYLAEIEESID